MNPALMGTLFPQGDMFGFSQLLQKAMQNPEQGAQMLAGLGMEPPASSPFGAGPTMSPFAELPGQIAPTPNERVAGGFESTPMAAPMEMGGPANPFPMPTPGADPFPTPYGAAPPAAAPAAPQAKAATLADALKGVSVPSAPEPQRVSSPGTPPQGRAAIDSGMVAMLTKMMSGQRDPMQLLRLGQTLGIGGK